jgi:putative transposase
MNRGARRLSLFERPADYTTFVQVLQEAVDRFSMRLLCWVVMPNHWHLVLWPKEDNDLSIFMAWSTGTHSRRWHLSNHSSGTGTLYQGRFKAIPVKDDGHFLTVCRYVEQNPVRARLVARPEDWEWSSASGLPHRWHVDTHDWPVPRPSRWSEDVNAVAADMELRRLREAIHRGIPFGPDPWRDRMVGQLGWRTGMRPPGRPRRPVEHGKE